MMLYFLLKSSACLLAFIVFYKLFLEQTSSHKLKRFYLLAVVIISIAIPFITIIKYVEPQYITGSFTELSIINGAQENTEKSVIDFIPTILWCIYGLGLLLFSIRFGINLSQILIKIKRNPKHKTSNFISVLLKDFVVPHTFFNYIFLTKSKFENKEIPKEVMLHEEAHAKQKHSLDILFIELLQVIFWFNPLVYILKKDIKLNHEFLADQGVISQGIKASLYQKVLLEFSSNSNPNQLANAINYSLIKKRFTIMKKQTSKQSIWLRSFLLLPLLAILIYGFSSTKEVPREIASSTKELVKTNNSKIDYNASLENIKKELIIMIQVNSIVINGKTSTLKTFKNDLDVYTKDWEETDYTSIKANIYIASTTQDYLKQAEKEFSKTHYSKANGGLKLISNKQKKQDGATKKQVAEYNKLAKYFNTNSKKNIRIKAKDVERLKYLYSLMNATQKRNAEAFPDLPEPPPAPRMKKSEVSKLPPPPPPPVSPNATPEEKEKQEKVIKGYYKHNTVKEGRVSKNPPPPPPPSHDKSKETGYININGETHFYVSNEGKKTYYNRWGVQVDKNGKELSPEEREKYAEARIKYTKERKKLSQAKHNEMKKRQKQSKERMAERKANYVEREMELKERKEQREAAMKERKAIMVKRGERSNIPPPPPPKSPLEHVTDMSKKGASFYYNGDAISSDKAIELVKNNQKINLSSQTNNGKSTVHLSTKPITIVNGKLVKEKK